MGPRERGAPAEGVSFLETESAADAMTIVAHAPNTETLQKKVPSSEFNRYAKMADEEPKKLRARIRNFAVKKFVSNLEEIWKDEGNRGYQLPWYADMARKGTGLAEKRALGILHRNIYQKQKGRDPELVERVDEFRAAVAEWRANVGRKATKERKALWERYAEEASARQKREDEEFRAAHRSLAKPYRGPTIAELVDETGLSAHKVYKRAERLGLETCFANIAHALDTIAGLVAKRGGKVPRPSALIRETRFSRERVKRCLERLKDCGAFQWDWKPGAAAARTDDGAALACVKLLRLGMLPTDVLLRDIRDMDALVEEFNKLPLGCRVKLFLYIAEGSGRVSKAELALIRGMGHAARHELESIRPDALERLLMIGKAGKRAEAAKAKPGAESEEAESQ